MAKKPTAADAELILKLYDLRREAEIRKARNWWLSFWPENADDVMKIGMAMGTQENADDVMKVGMAMGTQENAWLRQVGGYWELAASMVLHGVINQDLFMEGSFSGEMFFIFAKVHPFLKELREKMKSPTAFSNMEKVIMSTKAGRERLKQTEERQAAMRKMMAEAARAKAS